MATLQLKDIHKSYGDVQIIKGVDLAIEDREFCVFVGPSGCGKSTLLRMIAGLEEITSGDLTIDGQRVNDVPPAERGLAMVFQTYALYPHMSVADNMGFSLRLAGVPKAERKAKVGEAARILHLEPLLARKPKELSGGQRQRVAMGRAIVRQPQAFLMDEPLSNLDAKLRVQMRADIAHLQHELKTTTIYVTHDQVEAMTMGDRVAVMKDGVLQQVDTPLALYDRPANLFVAGFIGSPGMNLLVGKTAGDGVAVVDGIEIPIDRTAAAASSGSLTLGIRPESWRVADADASGYPVTVAVVEELGADAYVYATPTGVDAAGERLGELLPQIVARLEGRQQLSHGQTIRLVADPRAIHIFDTDTGARLALAG